MLFSANPLKSADSISNIFHCECLEIGLIVWLQETPSNKLRCIVFQCDVKKTLTTLAVLARMRYVCLPAFFGCFGTCTHTHKWLQPRILFVAQSVDFLHSFVDRPHKANTNNIFCDFFTVKILQVYCKFTEECLLLYNNYNVHLRTFVFHCIVSFCYRRIQWSFLVSRFLQALNL